MVVVRRARGINYRQNKVAGYFSQIGQLYTVHHIWRMLLLCSNRLDKLIIHFELL